MTRRGPIAFALVLGLGLFGGWLLSGRLALHAEPPREGDQPKVPARGASPGSTERGETSARYSLVSPVASGKAGLALLDTGTGKLWREDGGK
jgi:hypothetical protein